MSTPAGVYAHIPFCKQKCPYCDFFSIVDSQFIPAVIQAIPAEIDLTGQPFDRFDSLYIGGGTPSLLSATRLFGLLSSLLARLPFAADTEITVELNPADVQTDLLAALKDAGVNRLSLGVQSFDDEELRFLGRRHDAARAVQAIEQINGAGFADLGLDLMYGLPQARLTRWQASLQQALDLQPGHLSCYALTVAENTPLGEMKAAGQVELPGDDLLADLFLLTNRMLVAAGFEHYEVSNFARGPVHRSRHNQKYWRRTPTLGLGPAAHSFDGTRRWQNVKRPEEYLRLVARNEPPQAEREIISTDQARLETIALGLRTSDGMERAVLGEHKGLNSTIASLVSQGLLLDQERRLRPTPSGMLMADALARIFS